jgi:hypothetical protein
MPTTQRVKSLSGARMDVEWKGEEGSSRKMKITTASAGVFYADLTGENPMTADAVWGRLPIDGKANT